MDSLWDVANALGPSKMTAKNVLIWKFLDFLKHNLYLISEKFKIETQAENFSEFNEITAKIYMTNYVW